MTPPPFANDAQKSKVGRFLQTLPLQIMIKPLHYNNSKEYKPNTLKKIIKTKL